jgi:hypothetical protein
MAPIRAIPAGAFRSEIERITRDVRDESRLSKRIEIRANHARELILVSRDSQRQDSETITGFSTRAA